MRKFLLILACAFSVSARPDTNIVQITQNQWSAIQTLLNSMSADYWPAFAGLNEDGSIFLDYNPFLATNWQDALLYSQQNQYTILQFLHTLFTGDDGAYDTSNNNILAYASSLRDYLDSSTNTLHSIQSYISTYFPYFNVKLGQYVPLVQGLYNYRFYAGDKVVDLTNLSSNNFERLYDVITNFDFNVSISNQIDILQSLGRISNPDESISSLLSRLSLDVNNFYVDFVNGNTELLWQSNQRHRELMDFLHSLSNGAFFASNLCNCCGGANSNYQDSVIAMLNWMTNNFPDVAESPIGGGGGGSNNVWSIWRPSDVPSSGWFHLFVPSVEWVPSGVDSQQFKPRYGNYQYDSVYNAVWEEYYNLLENYRANGIDGQQFLAGLVDLQLHIMANMSTQLYMIDQKMPSKTNLWDWIEQYKSKISDEVTQAQQENSEIVSSVSYLLDYTPFGIVGGHFPKVSTALNSLRLEQGASPVLRIPIPSVLRVSDSDALVVDVRESEWFTTGRTWCRWIFTFIWGWLFIRLGIVPIFYVFFFTVRVAEISAHLVFMGSVRGSSGIVSSFGAAAVDMVLSLIGIDTDFKKFVWGIMRD